MARPLGIAVIGAGMAGKAHAAAYRTASTLYDSTLPPLRLISIGDVSETFGSRAARRFGYERHDTSWQAIAADPEIDVVSVVIANSLHREVVEGLLDAGKHVLCEKPLSDSLDEARAMAAAAGAAGTVARIGFTYRRSPGIAFIRDLVREGALGRIRHFSGRYWTDYAADPGVPLSWRFRGPAGSGALADVGSHLAYVAEFLAGPIREVSGGRFATVVPERPEPVGLVSGRGASEVSDTVGPVENDDYAAFSAAFDEGVGSFEVSRVATGHANTLEFEIFGDRGSATFDFRRPAEIGLFLNDGPASQRGFRQVLLGPEHPYLAGGLAMDTPGVGFGQNEGFVFQARAFLEEVVGIPEAESLPRCASFDEGVHNMELLQAVAASAADGGSAVRIASTEEVSA